MGAFDASPSDVLKALLGTHSDLVFTQAIQELRVPRIFGALLIGASLALAETSFQSLFRNQLVSPDILAVSLVLGLASVLRFPSTLTLLLSGVVLSALFAALFGDRRHSRSSSSSSRDDRLDWFGCTTYNSIISGR